MMTQSPGPWVVAGHPGGKWGTGFREVHSTGGEFSPAFVGLALEPDARLFAAAPDMRDALVTILARLDLEAAERGEGAVFPLAAMRDDIRAILARTEGAAV